MSQRGVSTLTRSMLSLRQQVTSRRDDRDKIFKGFLRYYHWDISNWAPRLSARFWSGFWSLPFANRKLLLRNHLAADIFQFSLRFRDHNCIRLQVLISINYNSAVLPCRCGFAKRYRNDYYCQFCNKRWLRENCPSCTEIMIIWMFRERESHWMAIYRRDLCAMTVGSGNNKSGRLAVQ